MSAAAIARKRRGVLAAKKSLLTLSPIPAAKLAT